MAVETTALDFECARCPSVGEAEIGDPDEPHLIKCPSCGHGSLYVWCEACGMGGLFVEDVSDQPKTWHCERCASTYPVPSDTYRRPTLASASAKPPERRSARWNISFVGNDWYVEKSNRDELREQAFRFKGYDRLDLVKGIAITVAGWVVLFLANPDVVLGAEVFMLAMALICVIAYLSVWAFYPFGVELSKNGVTEYRRYWGTGPRLRLVPWESVKEARYYAGDGEGGGIPIVILRSGTGSIAFATDNIWINQDLPPVDVRPGARFLREQLSRRNIQLKPLNSIRAALDPTL